MNDITGKKLEYVLTVKAPWGPYLFDGKSIETRSWPIPKGLDLPLRVYIHVGLSIDTEALNELPMMNIRMYPQEDYIGKIIGHVDFVKCVRFTQELWEKERKNHLCWWPWHDNLYGWYRENPVLLKRPKSTKGQLRLYTVDSSLVNPGGAA